MQHSQLRTPPGIDGDALAQIKRLLGEVYRLTDAVAAKDSGQAALRKTPQLSRLMLAGEGDESLTNRLTLAKFLLTLRRTRTRFLPADLFGEPAWDILLDLYIAHCEARPVSVSSAALAASVPQTTGLRWVNLLSDSGKVCRQPSADDGRMVFVSLSESAREAMDAYLDWVLNESVSGPDMVGAGR